MLQERKHFVRFTITLFDIIILILAYWTSLLIRAKLPFPGGKFADWYLPYYLKIFPIFLITFSSTMILNNSTLNKFPVDKYNFYLKSIISFMIALAIYIVILYYLKLFNQSRLAILFFGILSTILMILNRELISKNLSKL